MAKVCSRDGHGCKSGRLDAVAARTASAGGGGGGGRAGADGADRGVAPAPLVSEFLPCRHDREFSHRPGCWPSAAHRFFLPVFDAAGAFVAALMQVPVSSSGTSVSRSRGGKGQRSDSKIGSKKTRQG